MTDLAIMSELYGLHTIEDVQKEITQEQTKLEMAVTFDARQACANRIARLRERLAQLTRDYRVEH